MVRLRMRWVSIFERFFIASWFYGHEVRFVHGILSPPSFICNSG